MSYKTILLILLFINFQNFSWCQSKEESASSKLKTEVDFIAEHAILHRAFPGCVVYASQHGEPIFFESYGFHTYDSIQPVLKSDIYDLASITKVTASTIAMMKLYEMGAYALDDPLKKHIDGLGRRVGNVTIREALAHHGGLKSWIKYYEEIRKGNGDFKRNTLSDQQSNEYPYGVSFELFLHKDFSNKIKKYIKRSPVSDSKGYIYSGLFFYLIPELVESLSGLEFQSFLEKEFYGSLNAKTLIFNPLQKFDPSVIVPTEIDSFFRMEPIHGKVHDEGAILMNGVSGNAGLFGNAADLAKVWEMLINKGEGYSDGKKYLKPSTISLFTSCQYPNAENRRGLGFDKPLLEYDSIKSSVAKSSSIRSYGHSGFTGTLIWADPENGLLYIFLANRVYPSRKEKAIYDLNVRPEIHQLLYDYLE